MDSELRSLLSRFPGKRILVVGDVMLDEYLWGTVRRISPEAPVPVVELNKRSHVPGGAANTAANVAGLQAEVHLGGIVGDDDQGRLLAGCLTASGVQVDGLFVDRSRPTTTKTRILAHSQQVVRIDAEQVGPFSTSLEEQLLAWLTRRLPEVDGCILSDYAKGVVTPTLASGLLDKARMLGKPVVVDPKGTQFRRYRGATLVKPNLQEAGRFLKQELLTADEVLDAGRRLLDELGDGGGVLLTRGAAGMTLFKRTGDPLHIAAQAREVFDVTGAGDTVAGTLILALASGASLEQAARLASIAAGIIVGRVGTVAVRLQDLLEWIGW
jgi:rfaE bifunctional protein kinase chain/domain